MKTQEEKIKEDTETARRVILVLAHDIKRAAKRYLIAAENVNSEGIEPFNESFINELEVATNKLIETIKTAQMFHKYKK